MMKKSNFLEGFSIEELQERNEFSTVAEAGCCEVIDPTPCCCFGGPCPPK